MVYEYSQAQEVKHFTWTYSIIVDHGLLTDSDWNYSLYLLQD